MDDLTIAAMAATIRNVTSFRSAMDTKMELEKDAIILPFNKGMKVLVLKNPRDHKFLKDKVGVVLRKHGNNNIEVEIEGKSYWLKSTMLSRYLTSKTLSSTKPIQY